MQDDTFKRPFPALTSAQRYHLDVYGYVVVENTLSATEIASLYDALHELKKEILATPDPGKTAIRGAFMDGDFEHMFGFGHLIEAMPQFMNYYAHPRLVGMTEEVVGGDRASGGGRGHYQPAGFRETS